MAHTSTSSKETRMRKNNNLDGLAWSCCGSKLMNKPAGKNMMYEPTNIEHIANCITHGLWIIPSCIGCLCMLHQSTTEQHKYSAIIYGLSLICLFSVSTIFHLVAWSGKTSTLRFYLHVSDRAVIYLFIASSYTPWLTLRDMGFLGQTMRWFIWVMAVLGISYNYCFYEKYKKLETFFYFVIGFLPAISIVLTTSLSSINTDGLSEMALGGLIYVLGTAFFKSDGIIPCSHAIWHLFVAGGAYVHYYAVTTYLYIPNSGETD
ncbi:monocyte to macrophage differentiation factor-like [Anneissia japonica]|uniref:monocyte to macrophage differentiation factor-like n=1 Tax=Anneissia japonica TaxID=1529436 RepID=UPI0014259582|nr:monocyte to macrophage differentiation factor-like [Anneissia japonica]XP_033100467.1 monocyte to macrophage differentiation factor-like [Anneissia japonica]